MLHVRLRDVNTPTLLLPLVVALGLGQRRRGACWAGGGRLSSVCGGPTSVFVLLWGRWRRLRLFPRIGFSVTVVKGK